MIARKWLFQFLFFIVLFLTVIAYAPGLSGDFVFDDEVNIIKNDRLAITGLTADQLIQAAFSSNSGILKRPLSMLTFAFNFYMHGFSPYFFKLTNVAIHLLSGLGIFFLTYLLLGAYQARVQTVLSNTHIRWISLGVMAIWLLHPLNLTSVLYVVQRMASLAGLFTIWGLVFYVWGRSCLDDQGGLGRGLIFVGLFLFGGLAVLSKENGVLLPLYILVIEFTIFGLKTDKQNTRLFLKGFFSLLVIIPVIIIIAYFLIYPEWLMTGYRMRDFNLSERLMTEARVTWFYLRLIVIPDISAMGLHHDDIAISRGLLDPVSTLPALLGIASMMGIGVVARERTPILSFGLLFFLGGHFLESTILPLEIAHEHRNYLPMYGVLMMGIFFLLNPVYKSPRIGLRATAVIMLIGLFAFNLSQRATYWGNERIRSLIEVTNHPNSSSANYQMGRIFSALMNGSADNKDQYYAEAHRYFESSSKLDRNDTSAFFAIVVLNNDFGIAVEPGMLDELKRRLRNAPFAAASASWLDTLVRCQSEKRCRLPDQEVASILQSGLDNPTLFGIAQATSLTAASNFMANQIHNYENAMRLSYQAVEAAPRELQYRLNLIGLLIAVKKFDEARQQIILIRHLDKLGAYTQKINEREKALVSRQANVVDAQ